MQTSCRFRLSGTLAGALLLLFSGCAGNDPVVEGLPFYNTPDFTPRWIAEGSSDYPDIHTIGPFSFANQNGEIVSESDFEGKIYVADFIFTTCPSICPPMTQHMGVLQKAFRDDPQIRFISYSVTPDIDTVPVLRSYADAHDVIDGKWHLVTGDREQIYTLARRSYFADKDIGFKKGAEDFLHTDNFILVDSRQRIRGVYGGVDRAEIQRLIEDIRTLKKEG